jgi:ABC-type multidrug transport system ATPase subunit
MSAEAESEKALAKSTKAETPKAKAVDGDEAQESPPSSKPPASSPKAEASEVSETTTAKPKKKKKKKGTAEAAVRLKKLTKKFGSKIAVEELTLEIEAGTVYGLIGPNGAGKTTTFSMLAGYLQPTEGTVEVLGFAPSQVVELKNRLGVLPQDAMLPPGDKVGEFLVHMARLQGIPREKAESMSRAVLEEVDGRDWWNVKCNALSHGMAKRVQLAQALLGDPEVVLLDEPTSGLDPRSAYEVRQIIKSRKGRATLIVSSHNLQELEEICDAAAILDRGHLVAAGTISELTAASEEVHIKIAAPLKNAEGAVQKKGSAATLRSVGASVPIAAVRELAVVKRAEWDDERHELIVYFERGEQDAESVIGHVLWLLLNQQVRISAVTKGRGLEQRVMDLTDQPDDDDEDDDD